MDLLIAKKLRRRCDGGLNPKGNTDFAPCGRRNQRYGTDRGVGELRWVDAKIY